MKLTKLFTEFFNSEKSGGLILICCTVLSLTLANSSLADNYMQLWHYNVFSKSTEFWINDGLMTIFFLLVGLEIERELYIGELAGVKKAMLPVMGAIGGMALPALIHFIFNQGSVTQNGFGIPMATDIAFSLAILSLLGKKVPASLKIFLTALAIIDDLGAILIIAFFYSNGIALMYLGFAALLFVIMLVMNRLKVYMISIYLLLGCLMWFCMYRSGIHPTITGVLLAFAIPFGNGDEASPSYKLQHHLHKIAAFLILPLFALANTAIAIPSSFSNDLITPNSLGIILGLLAGKPLGVFLFAILGIVIGWCSLPGDIQRKHIFGAGLLAGIGFTMSIFITLLAFTDAKLIDSAKIAVIVASVLAGLIGYLWLRFTLKDPVAEINPATDE
ncbi:MAG: Na+/H+ antiporter NhaA [Chitinophagaceae bacterium]